MNTEKNSLYKASTCCQDCEHRQLHCHSTCQAYKEFRKNMDKRNAQIRKERMRLYSFGVYSGV